ncbi:hypothetical protein JTE90_003573 [Oedothorax gibbosus]|uniref:Chibby n=1 Tax=Oedothorax gibbosus TaxID=931172 RepID=A0AAV6VIJ7_9ARAC|nr:hypothetical protein JTE90_003573 [Oedothorax gibbosus]
MFDRKNKKNSVPPTKKSKTPSSYQLHLDPVLNPAEYGLNYGKISMKIGSSTLEFDDGKWISYDTKKSSPKKSPTKHSTEMQQLLEENNALKLKLKVLLLLLSELKIKAADSITIPDEENEINVEE